MNRIESFSNLIGQEIVNACSLAEKRRQGEAIPDFDIRGKLYGLAMEMAPVAREGDLDAMCEWLQLGGDERIVDLAAGTGYFTKRFVDSTQGEVIAVDPSTVQLSELDRLCAGRATCISGSPDNKEAMRQISEGSVDVVSSFGGLHHVLDQRMMMEEVARILRPGGQFTAADVCADTSLARHFDEFVAEKCITGHEATWLSEARLRELAEGLPLKLEKVEVVPLTWKFTTKREMALFFRGLHAYDLTEKEIVDDLQTALGYTECDGAIHLNWPMIFFRFVRE